MNKEMMDLAAYFVDNKDCVAELWKEHDGSDTLELENLGIFGYVISITETENNDLGEKFLIEYNFKFGNNRHRLAKARNLVSEQIEYYITRSIEEYNKYREKQLTGQYILISEVKESGEKNVIETIPLHYGDKMSSDDIGRINVALKKSNNKNKQYVYNNVYLGVDKPC